MHSIVDYASSNNVVTNTISLIDLYEISINTNNIHKNPYRGCESRANNYVAIINE